jgi:hypothetical protein
VLPYIVVATVFFLIGTRLQQGQAPINEPINNTAVTAGTVNPVATAVVSAPVAAAATVVTVEVPRTVEVTRIVEVPKPIEITSIATRIVEVTRVIVATPTSLPTPDSATIPGAFRDDFNISLKPDWSIVQPGFSVKDGNLVGGGAILYNPTSQNYTIKTNVKFEHSITFLLRIKEIDSPFQGFELSCTGEYCYWIDIGAGGNDSRRISDDIPINPKFKPDDYHEFTFEVRGRDYIASIDGKPFSSITNEKYQSNTVVGIYGASVGTTIDYFEVIPLP